MPTFTISGEFWAVDIDEAISFLARYFTDAAAAGDAVPEYDRISLIAVERKDEPA